MELLQQALDSTTSTDDLLLGRLEIGTGPVSVSFRSLAPRRVRLVKDNPRKGHIASQIEMTSNH